MAEVSFVVLDDVLHRIGVGCKIPCLICGGRGSGAERAPNRKLDHDASIRGGDGG